MQDGDPASPPVSVRDFESNVGQTVCKLTLDAVDSFNYAAWQNAVPVLRSIVIDNSEGPELSALTLELHASIQFAQDRCWVVDRINAGEKLSIKAIDLDIVPEYLDSLDEAERGVLTFRLIHQGTTLHEIRHTIRVLARDEWGGMESMGELLPAFVTPNDPALAVLLRSAATLLGQHGHATALDGYQSGDPNRVYMLAASLWSAVAGCKLVYAMPPGSFEQVGQKTRRIGTVLSDELATCLDTSLLFASGLEAMGLNPILVMTRGHCFAGVWLVNKTFQRPIERDCVELRKAVAAKELVVFETTLVTHHPPARFPDAISTAMGAISEGKESEFVAVIDVSRGRMSQVRPLASHSLRSGETHDEPEPALPPLPASPEINNQRLSEPTEPPQTPAGRIERWQRKLLDLSLRNRLLNFRPSKQTVPVLCPDVSRLEDRLANGIRMRLVSLADANPLGHRDSELHQRRTQKDLDWEFASQALDRDEIVCPVDEHELDARLTALFRKVRNDLAEGGSNTLYLAVGFLRWKQTPTDTTSYRAPLLLVPVTLARRSASSPYDLTSHEDDVQFNATLLQMLKKDFSCDLSTFETDLPTDDSGVDVPLILERVRHAVREIQGFEVIEEAAIAPFSFAKYLMWKDLVERVGQLEHNRVVRHLIHDPDKAFLTGGHGSIPQPPEIDRRYTPQQIVHPLPADSSQLAAVMAASEGHDLVIVGPPGTGKSQTIANIIAQCLSVGKTILFVAEKTAALDVVYRRLREHGLSDCCVELHSNKAERRHFLDQLNASWRNRGQTDALDWVTINEHLRIRRDHLNAYVAAIHAPEPNGWTVYRAMGEYVRGRDLAPPRLNWPATVSHDHAEYAEMRAVVGELATAWTAVPIEATQLPVRVNEWSMAWENTLLESCRQLVTASESLSSSLHSLWSTLGVPIFDDVSSTQISQFYRFAQELARQSHLSPELLSCFRLEELQTALDERRDLLQRSRHANDMMEYALIGFCTVLGIPQAGVVPEPLKRSLYRLANELTRSDLPRPDLVFHDQLDHLKRSLADRPTLLHDRDRSRDALEARSFNPVLIDRIPVESIEKQWVAASKSIWPLSQWRKSDTAKTLQAYMSAGGVATPGVDLPLLVEYRAARVRLDENLKCMRLPPDLLAKVDTDIGAIEQALQSAQMLRDIIQATGANPIELGIATGRSLKPLKIATRQLIMAGREVESLRVSLKENIAVLGLSADLQSKVENDAGSMDQEIQDARRFQEAALALGMSDEQHSRLLAAVLNIPDEQRRQVASEYCGLAKCFQVAWSNFTRHAGSMPAAKESTSVIAEVAATAQRILSQRPVLKRWVGWLSVQARARRLGLESFVDAIESGELTASDAVARFDLAYARWWLPTIVDNKEPLRRFQKYTHEDAIEQFRHLDDRARHAAESRVRQGVQHYLPSNDQVPRKSELGLLRHQMGLKRPSKSIREMIAGMPETFGKLAPCLLMSPLSIAQYLPVEQALFDVVVFDEASQIATWDAIGAIARGRQTIIVGDPKQLPPTNFFGRAESDEDNSELSDHEKDMESILDEAQASGLPTLQLNWHYRSRHESLIAFSNWNYYGNQLVTFPAAESTDRGVSFRHVKGALYDRGKSRTNRQEAEAIVSDLVERMKRSLSKPAKERPTHGVVTFNSQQQEMIQDLLDDALRKNPELEWFFSDDRIEPTIVKNLENVQGDERDVMMFSITFGHDAAGKFPVDFGAINRDGGERRLNVAITRARQELVVFASFLPDQLRAERSNARGVRDLKAFLEYAEKGPEAMVARADGSLGGFESPLEEAIGESLKRLGWQIDTQIGVSGFRIDLGVVHPDKPGAYLAGVECDGVTYHRSAMARDRDKTRQHVLENLGWTIVRVWSTDWWYDPDGAIRQLHATLSELLDINRKKRSDEQASPSTQEYESVTESEHPFQPAQPDPVPEVIDRNGAEDLMESFVRPLLVTGQTGVCERSFYVRVDLGNAMANQIRFFDDDYSVSLKGMALAVLEVQSPICDEALAREVARAHGFARTGNRIKERILDLLPNITTTVESVGTFLWHGPSSLPSVPFRFHSTEGDRRSLDEIAAPELIGLVRDLPDLHGNDDPALALAREIGLARLSRGSRERLEEAIEASRSVS